MNRMRRYFVFFLISGFTGLAYETIWVRLSMASFGVTPAALSIVVSVFMAGLALGAWLVTRWRERLAMLDAKRAARAYALIELAIGVLGLIVPPALKLGAFVAAHLARGHGPVAWYGAAFVWQAIVLLPATTAMGATIPIGMFAIGKAQLPGHNRSFSYLYLANVLGAVAGCLIPTFFLIEVLGFADTLRLAFVLNLGIAATAWEAARHTTNAAIAGQESAPPATTTGDRTALVLLFLTGLCSMGAEVVWTRQFTAYLGTVVYSFAAILAVYLTATFLGSGLYRTLKPSRSSLSSLPWGLVAITMGLPLLACDVLVFGLPELFDHTYEVGVGGIIRVALAIGPLSATLGFLTPMLVDRYSLGRAERAAVAYAVNTIGCIIGPLLAGFVLLPWVSERWALALLSLPFVAASFLLARGTKERLVALIAAGTCALLVWGTRSLPEAFPEAQVQRDYTATTIASGSGMGRRLFVNGVGMTVLTPITKIMAHLPLALLDHPAKRVLDICFGMGTTFRALNRWKVDVTAVELVPGVPLLFPYFHADATAVLALPQAHVVIDDGRRFLEAASEPFDLITVDPPPPISAASSSLLYSTEFYQLARDHLAPGGILMQWIPGGDDQTIAASVRSITAIFPHVVMYRSFGVGFHFLATLEPLAIPDAATLAARLPKEAADDLIEWGPGQTAEAQFARVLAQPISPEALIERRPNVPLLTDDQPVNEYYFLRRLLER